GGARRGVHPGPVPQRGGCGALPYRGGHFEMSETGTATKQWYVVHTYSGFENKVAAAIESRAKIFGLQDMIGRVVVPNEKVREIRKSKKIETEQKFFPGYLLVEMEMSDETWHLVRSTPKVTGFVGGTANKPTPITQKEVDAILRQVQEGVEKPRPKVLFEMGEAVRVKEGPFTDFHGNVEDVN